MADTVHPLWGRVIDTYDGAYVFDAALAREESISSSGGFETVYGNVRGTVEKLSAMGQSTSEPNWGDSANRITLSMLKSVMQHISSFPCFMPTMRNPSVIHGCIKLMNSITRFGRPSPFSYEYGHVCFRILVVVLDFCMLLLSDRYDRWVEELNEKKVQPFSGDYIRILSKIVSDLVVDCMTDTIELYNKFLADFPWADSYIGPLATTTSTRLLAKILDDDRKHFLIFLRSNYSLRLSSVLYLMCHHMHRTRPSPENRPYIESFIRIYPRYLLVAPGPPFGQAWVHDYVLHVSRAYDSTRQRLDLEDSRLVLRAYVDRLTVLSGTSLHPRATSTLALELLQYVHHLIRDGCEDLLPSAIRATIRSMKGDLDEGLDIGQLVHSFIHLLAFIYHLLDLLVEQAESARPMLYEAMDVIAEEQLASLLTRTLLSINPTDEELLDHQGPTEFFIHAAKDVFLVLQENIPQADFQRRFGEGYLQVFGLGVSEL